MNRIQKVAAVAATAATLTTVSGVAAAPADAALRRHVVTMRGGYGHVIVEGYSRRTGNIIRQTLWSGQHTSPNMSAAIVIAVGEGRSCGVLYWKRPGPDLRLGSWGVVYDTYVTVYVRPRSC